MGAEQKKRRRPGRDAASQLGMGEYDHLGYVGIKFLTAEAKE